MKRIFIILCILWGLSANLLALDAMESASSEKDIQSIDEQDINDESSELLIFGQDFFKHPPIGEALLTGGTLSPEYPLGPGDQLVIHLGGKAQQDFNVTVSTDGKIYIPNIGVYQVYGMPIADFQILITKELAKFYQNYDVSIILASPKRVRISVVGEVKLPGNYTLSALNTVIDALQLANGPTEKGSLRNIQIIRADSVVAFVDLYDFLLKPTGSTELFLQNGDRVFVPIVSARVKVTGQVQRPAIYELSEQTKETLDDLVQLAGGLTDKAFAEKVEYVQMNDDGREQVNFLDLQNSAHDFVMKNCNKIHVYSIDQKNPHISVAIYGQVNEPGEYDFQENMRVSDLILKAGGLQRNAYQLTAQVARVSPDNVSETIDISLENLSSAENDLILTPDDQVFVRPIPEWLVGPKVDVRGEVKFPGFYAIKKDSTTLSEIIKKAGGLLQTAHLQEAALKRFREAVPEDKEFERLKTMAREEMTENEYQYLVMKENSNDVHEIVVNFKKLLVDKDKSQDIILKDGDVITVPTKPNVVWVTGQVARDGGILYKEGAGFDYYIKQAGGYSWDAAKNKVKIVKVTGEIVKKNNVKKFEPGDRIWVPRKADYNFWQIFRDTIMVAGQLATIYLVIKTATN